MPECQASTEAQASPAATSTRSGRKLPSTGLVLAAPPRRACVWPHKYPSTLPRLQSCCCFAQTHLGRHAARHGARHAWPHVHGQEADQLRTAEEAHRHRLPEDERQVRHRAEPLLQHGIYAGLVVQLRQHRPEEAVAVPVALTIVKVVEIVVVCRRQGRLLSIWTLPEHIL